MIVGTSLAIDAVDGMTTLDVTLALVVAMDELAVKL